MSDTGLTTPTADTANDAGADPRSVWMTAMEELTAEEGYFHPLGARHYVFFADLGTTLLVSFERLEDILARPGQMPLAHPHAEARGWSHVCVIADGDTWFRDPAVYGYFDRLVDETFLEDFDQVLFFGAGMGGYAACAYSVAAPGAHVLALNPRATLNPAQTGWDRRDLAARKLDFTSRYGYAPDMLEGAAQVSVIHDPTMPAEAGQAALFRAPYITRLSARHMGDQLAVSFAQMGLLPALLDAAMKGSLTTMVFATLWRQRRDNATYLRGLLQKAEVAGRAGLEVMICKSVTRRMRAPRFERRLARLMPTDAG